MDIVKAMDRRIIPLTSQKKMSNWFFCKFCNMIMLHVYQLACGHLICGNCKKSLEKDGFKVCPDNPNCTKSCTSDDAKIFEDRCQGRTIQNFKTECINTKLGCTWVGELSAYSDHYEACKERFNECMEKDKRDFEQEEVIIEKIYPLGFKCNVPSIIAVKDAGRNSINITPCMDCPYCEESGFTSDEHMKLHLEHECPKALLPCPFTEVGCPEYQRQSCEDLEAHARIGNEIHLNLLLRDHLSLRRICMDEFDQLFESKKKFAALNDDIKRLGIDMVALSKRSELSNHDSEGRFRELLTQISDLKSEQRKSSTEKFEMRLGNMEAMLACFQEDRINGPINGNDEGRVKAIETAVENLTSFVKVQENKVSKLEKELEFRDSRIESLEAQLSNGEMTSHDGVLLWRINDFIRKRHDAITKRKTYILSPPFFSGPRGYKMCIRLYINGDGQGKGTHLSVFFTILKGPYDAVLPWPFKQTVYLAILNQSGGPNAEDSFRPDPHSMSFQRPKKEANISSGCPLFLPLSSLDNDGFIQDNCLFLKASVDGFSL